MLPPYLINGVSKDWNRSAECPAHPRIEIISARIARFMLFLIFIVLSIVMALKNRSKRDCSPS